jgi:hypothetical protein
MYLVRSPARGVSVKRSRDRIKVKQLKFDERGMLRRQKGYVHTEIGASLGGVLRLLARTANRTGRAAHADFNSRQITVRPGLWPRRAAAAKERVLDQFEDMDRRGR